MAVNGAMTPPWVSLLSIVGVLIAVGGAVGSLLDGIADRPLPSRLSRQQWGTVVGLGVGAVLYAVVLVVVYR